jgi:hypothetical protein
MLDENEFLGTPRHRSISKFHERNPYVFHVNGQEYRVDYLPAESNTGMFGGNSNWRGPVWMPVNALIIRALQNFYLYYGDNFKIECPTGSGRLMNLFEVSKEISDRLVSTFTRDDQGRRPVYGGSEKFRPIRIGATTSSSTSTSTATTAPGWAPVTRPGGPGSSPSSSSSTASWTPSARCKWQEGRVRKSGSEMKAITVEPHKPESARLEDIAEPDARDGSVLVEAVAVGRVRDRCRNRRGKVRLGPSRKTRLVLGHESLGRVVDPGPNSSLKEG